MTLWSDRPTNIFIFQWIWIPVVLTINVHVTTTYTLPISVTLRTESGGVFSRLCSSIDLALWAVIPFYIYNICFPCGTRPVLFLTSSLTDRFWVGLMRPYSCPHLLHSALIPDENIHNESYVALTSHVSKPCKDFAIRSP